MTHNHPQAGTPGPRRDNPGVSLTWRRLSRGRRRFRLYVHVLPAVAAKLGWGEGFMAEATLINRAELEIRPALPGSPNAARVLRRESGQIVVVRAEHIAAEEGKRLRQIAGIVGLKLTAVHMVISRLSGSAAGELGGAGRAAGGVGVSVSPFHEANHTVVIGAMV